MSKKRQKPLEELDMYGLLERLGEVENPIYDLATESSSASDIGDAGNALKEAKAGKRGTRTAEGVLGRKVAALNKLIASAEAAAAAIPGILKEIRDRRDKLVAEAYADPEPDKAE